MPRIKQESVDALNKILDAEQVLSYLGARWIQHNGPETRSGCPEHGSDHQRSLAVRVEDNVIMCHNTGCRAHEGGSLLWLHALVHDCSIREAAEFWARKLGYSLEYERPQPHPSEFAYVEAASHDAQGRFCRNRLVTLGRVPEATRDPNCEIFISAFRYNLSRMPVLRKALREGTAFLYGDWYADFDNPFPEEGGMAATLLGNTPFAGIGNFREGIERAQREAVTMIEKLLEHDVSVQSVLPFFSGRGFHVQVDARVFGVIPSTYLHQIYQRLAYRLAGVDANQDKIPLLFGPGGRCAKAAHRSQLPCMDQNIYQAARLWRLPGSVNLKSGKYKIPLSIDELSHLGVDEILDLASRPRPLPRRGPVEKREKARQLFYWAWQEVREERQEGRSLPESQLIQKGFDVIYLDSTGKPIRGKLPRHIAHAAVQLARKAHCPVVLAIRKEGGSV